MLTILIGSDLADFADDVQIPIKLTNPMFSQSGFEEGYTYSFSLPNTKRNQVILRKYAKNEIPISISSSLTPLMGGTGRVYQGNKSISVEIKNFGLIKKNELDEISLRDFDYPVINIANISDSPTVKIDKWHAHKNLIRNSNPPEKEMYCFPPISRDNGTVSFTSPPDGDNFLHATNALASNFFLIGDYLKNASETSTPPESVNFRTSLAPAIFFKYVLEKVLAESGIILVSNELNDILEYHQLFFDPGMHLDKIVQDPLNASKYYNVHGEEIDLNLFILDKSILSMLTVLRELFGCSYYFNNNRLEIKLYNKLLKRNPIDMSKYCDGYFEQSIIGQEYQFKFPVDLKKNKFGWTFWRNHHDINPTPEWEYKWNDFSVGNATTTQKLDYSYIPLKTIWTLIWTVPNEPDDLLLPLSMFACFSDFKSSYWNSQDFNPVDVYNVGLWRGNFPVYDNLSSTWKDTIIASNEYLTYPDETKELYETGFIPYYQPMQYVLGTMSLYPRDDKSHFNQLQLDYYKLLADGREIKELLNLPIHKIYEVIQWKEVQHIIQQRNMSFIGTVKEVSFTLYKNGVSPTLITYLSQSSDKSGTFNDDFNDDFVIQ